MCISVSNFQARRLEVVQATEEAAEGRLLELADKACQDPTTQRTLAAALEGTLYNLMQVRYRALVCVDWVVSNSSQTVSLCWTKYDKILNCVKRGHLDKFQQLHETSTYPWQLYFSCSTRHDRCPQDFFGTPKVEFLAFITLALIAVFFVIRD